MSTPHSPPLHTVSNSLARAASESSTASLRDDRLWFGALTLWGLTGFVASALGWVSMDRLPIVPATIVGSVLVLALAYRRVASFRSFARRIDLRIPILFHVVRLPIGAAFLVLEAQGRLPATFATRAGWGDVLTGGLAVGAAIAAAKGHARLVGAWNLLGLVDILMVVGTANYLLFVAGRPEALRTMTAFPWSAIPIVVVPLVIATHVLVYARLRAAAAGERGRA